MKTVVHNKRERGAPSFRPKTRREFFSLLIPHIVLRDITTIISMSFKEIYQLNLKSLELGSKLNILPIEFTKCGTAKITKSIPKRITFYCLLANAVLYTLYICIRYIQVLTAENISILQFAPHTLVLIFALISGFWFWYLFVYMEPLTNIVLNELLDIISEIRPTKARLQERSVKFLPGVCIEASVVIMSIPYIVSPDSPQTVYSGLTVYFEQSPILMVATMTYELLTFWFLAFAFNYNMFVQLGILQTTQRELEAGVKELNQNAHVTWSRLLEDTEKCRRIQLRIAYFNKVYSWSVYILKLECMCTGTFGLFFGIKLFETHPTLGALSAMMGLTDIECYCAMYSRAFEIPILMTEYRELIMAKAARVEMPESMEVCKAIRSISRVAIVVGQFDELQRSSTAEFFDFVINNVVGFLVSYPGPIVL